MIIYSFIKLRSCDLIRGVWHAIASTNTNLNLNLNQEENFWTLEADPVREQCQS